MVNDSVVAGTMVALHSESMDLDSDKVIDTVLLDKVLALGSTVLDADAVLTSVVVENMVANDSVVLDVDVVPEFIAVAIAVAYESVVQDAILPFASVVAAALC